MNGETKCGMLFKHNGIIIIWLLREGDSDTCYNMDEFEGINLSEIRWTNKTNMII